MEALRLQCKIYKSLKKVRLNSEKTGQIKLLKLFKILFNCRDTTGKTVSKQ